jgi:hypothetical protein
VRTSLASPCSDTTNVEGWPGRESPRGPWRCLLDDGGRRARWDGAVRARRPDRPDVCVGFLRLAQSVGAPSPAGALDRKPISCSPSVLRSRWRAVMMLLVLRGFKGNDRCAPEDASPVEGLVRRPADESTVHWCIDGRVHFRIAVESRGHTSGGLSRFCHVRRKGVNSLTDHHPGVAPNSPSVRYLVFCRIRTRGKHHIRAKSGMLGQNPEPGHDLPEHLRAI